MWIWLFFLSTVEEDVFQCGKCKRKFSSLSQFLAHKQHQCMMAERSSSTTSDAMTVASVHNAGMTNTNVIYTAQLAHPQSNKQITVVHCYLLKFSVVIISQPSKLIDISWHFISRYHMVSTYLLIHLYRDYLCIRQVLVALYTTWHWMNQQHNHRLCNTRSGSTATGKLMHMATDAEADTTMPDSAEIWCLPTMLSLFHPNSHSVDSWTTNLCNMIPHGSRVTFLFCQSPS